MTDPGAFPSKDSSSNTASTPFIGNVANARIPKTGPWGMAMGPLTQPGYVKGDQVKLLPTNGGDLAYLQQAMVQAGYITQSQANQMVLGSPDEITTTAFAKLLATANMSGVSWKNALSLRLAAAGQQAPAAKKAMEVPPLTISLTNPDDIKATLQKSAQTLLGGNMSDDQANFFVSQFQQVQRDQQTAAYNQQYDPARAAAGEGVYGPGGTTTAPPDLGVAAQSYAKAADPTQYTATQIGAGVSSALDKLRTTGYL